MKTLNERYNYGLDLFLLSIDEGITGYLDDSLEVITIAAADLSFVCGVELTAFHIHFAIDC